MHNTFSASARTMAGITALLIAIATPPAAAQETPSLPGGASSLQETFGDWRFACQTVEAITRCAITQQQVRQDGQRVLSVELQPGADGGATGALVLPFGLRLDAGVTLQVGEQPVGEPLRLHTCLQIGCVVRLPLDAATVNALRIGKALTVSGKAADTDQDILLAIPLTGFAAALDRMTAFQ